MTKKKDEDTTKEDWFKSHLYEDLNKIAFYWTILFKNNDQSSQKSSFPEKTGDEESDDG